RQGDFVAGPVRSQGERTRGRGNNPLLWPELVNGRDVSFAQRRPRFEHLTVVYPDRQVTLETTAKRMNTRIIDIIAPIGKGQRALIVAPPKAGKTVILKDIAHAVAENYPAIHIVVALIGERPEEVTDMRRSIKGEVYSSTFDEQVEHQCETSDRALDRAKRLVESGEDVLLVLDSLTRLARAFNVKLPSSGKTLSGGMDPLALYPPKQFFGAARNCEEGGSLTIVATALIDTGSRLDDLIYEEFKGTGNMELHLDRTMAERRIFPAVAMDRSGTRHEELLQSPDTLRQVWLLRRMLALLQQQSSSGNPTEGTERIIERLARSKDNASFLRSITEK
ncbi:MAG: transcription termination factor Rho, partial [Chloroflexi bacterium]|nr:transcription termination factor Rho [Chloroflexota bacterium]